MAFPNTVTPLSENTEFQDTYEKVRSLQENLRNVLLWARWFFIEANNQAGKDIALLSHTEFTTLKSQVTIIKILLWQLLAVPWYRLRPNDNRTQREKSDITTDVDFCFNASVALLSLWNDFLQTPELAKRQRPDYFTPERMFDFYFKSLALTNASIVEE